MTINQAVDHVAKNEFIINRKNLAEKVSKLTGEAVTWAKICSVADGDVPDVERACFLGSVHWK